MKHLNEYIVVADNIVPQSLCDDILTEYVNSDDWIPATIRGGLDANVRSCKTIGLSFSSVIDKNPSIRAAIDKSVFDCASKAIDLYNLKFDFCKIDQDSGYELLEYREGQFYTQHVDSFRQRPRAVSCSFVLNDSFEGGEFAFFDRELIYNVPKGSAIMFPSNFMYPHEVIPVTKGVRYSIVTWFI